MNCKVDIISHDEELHTYYDEIGDADTRLYKVFPGIELAYHVVHTDWRKLEASENNTIIEIRHCQKGRIEQHFNGEFFYLKPGDFSMIIRKNEELELKFPLRHYHGITIFINTDMAPECFSCFLEDVNVQPLNVAQKLCNEKKSFVARNKPYIEHIFNELYSVPEQYKKGFFKVKVLELLLVLSGIKPSENKLSSVSLSQTQVQLARQVSEYLRNSAEQNFTVGELSKKFSISKSHLQNAFRGVYGLSVFEYIRAQKMQQAASKLINTDKSILEIANEYSYDNGSKFTAAFRKVMGETPTEYRKTHCVR